MAAAAFIESWLCPEVHQASEADQLKYSPHALQGPVRLHWI